MSRNDIEGWRRFAAVVAASLVALVVIGWRGGGLSDAMATGLFALSVAGFCVAMAGAILGEALLRVVLALAPLLAAAMAAIAALILPSALPDTAKSALIAGTVFATGWLAAFLAAEVQKARERAQVADDVLHALRSEVVTLLDKLDKHPIRADANRAQARILAKGKGFYHPFAASESPTTVYEGVKASLVVVDREALEPVLRFYAAFSELDALVKDFRTEACAALEADRRAALHEELVKQRLFTLFWALRALYAINRALSVANPDKIARSGRNPEVTLDDDL